MERDTRGSSHRSWKAGPPRSVLGGEGWAGGVQGGPGAGGRPRACPKQSGSTQVWALLVQGPGPLWLLALGTASPRNPQHHAGRHPSLGAAMGRPSPDPRALSKPSPPAPPAPVPALRAGSQVHV